MKPWGCLLQASRERGVGCRRKARGERCRRCCSAGRAAGACGANATTSAAPTWPDGWVEVVVPIESVDHAAREMLRLGPEAEALAPPALRRALQEMAQRMAAVYAAPA